MSAMGRKRKLGLPPHRQPRTESNDCKSEPKPPASVDVHNNGCEQSSPDDSCVKRHFTVGVLKAFLNRRLIRVELTLTHRPDEGRRQCEEQRCNQQRQEPYVSHVPHPSRTKPGEPV